MIESLVVRAVINEVTYYFNVEVEMLGTVKAVSVRALRPKDPKTFDREAAAGTKMDDFKALLEQVSPTELMTSPKLKKVMDALVGTFKYLEQTLTPQPEKSALTPLVMGKMGEA